MQTYGHSCCVYLAGTMSVVKLNGPPRLCIRLTRSVNSISVHHTSAPPTGDFMASQTAHLRYDTVYFQVLARHIFLEINLDILYKAV